MSSVVSLDDICELITYTESVDNRGVTTMTPYYKKVFCGIKSIGGKEFADVGKLGIKPELVAVIRYEMYSGTVDVRYKGTVYSVYRYYHIGKEYTELYLKLKEGVANGRTD